MPETIRRVVVDHAGRLHESIANRRADELETASFQFFAHRIGFLRARGYIGEAAPCILFRFALDKLPDERSKAAKFILHLHESLRIAGYGANKIESLLQNEGIVRNRLNKKA